MKANIKYSPHSYVEIKKVIFDEKYQLFKGSTIWQPLLSFAHLFNYIYEDKELIDMFVGDDNANIKVFKVKITTEIIE